MKTLIKIGFLATLLFASSSYANFLVNLDAGKLRGAGGAAPLASDGTNNSNNGSLLLIIAAGNDGAFSNTLSLNQYVSGNDILLAAGGFNMNIGADETGTVFNVLTSPTVNDLIALRWFPQITFAQYKSGVLPTGGQTFGTYNPRTSNPANLTRPNPDAPDGPDNWLVPGSNSLALTFLTTDTGGTQPAILGYANSTVVGVPEPSTWAMLIGVGALIVSARFLRVRKQLPCEL